VPAARRSFAPLLSVRGLCRKGDKLGVKPDTSAAVVGFNPHFNTPAKAQIVGLFER